MLIYKTLVGVGDTVALVVGAIVPETVGVRVGVTVTLTPEMTGTVITVPVMIGTEYPPTPGVGTEVGTTGVEVGTGVGSLALTTRSPASS